MLRIVDTRTGRLAEIPSVRRHLLSICVHLPVGDDAGIGLPDLRALLVGDVLARTAELHGLQSRTFLTTPDLPAERTEALGRAMSALGIHPPATVGVHHPNGTLCAAADAHVHTYGTAAQDVAGGVLVGVGEVGPASRESDVPDGARRLDAVVPEGTDPLAVRLLMLGHPYRTPVTVTDAALDEARRTLGDWRQRVADWAQEPSRPIPADVLRHAHAVLADDLGVPAVLDMLAAVETRADVPAGAKFETFAFLDRVLGLDLAREVGHQHRAAP
ncbi:hypothetical protein [Streptomyces sp. NPDC058583]|uniref:hypothetical protein n=1 Tax=unclassified Streptomyces TaxID=2593676 RepID=UPI00364E27DF